MTNVKFGDAGQHDRRILRTMYVEENLIYSDDTTCIFQRRDEKVTLFGNFEGQEAIPDWSTHISKLIFSDTDGHSTTVWDTYLTFIRLIRSMGDYRGSGDEPLRLIGGAADDTASGTVLNDTFRGNSGDDDFRADEGNDRLLGGAGNDILSGDEGYDLLTGGSGTDVFRYWDFHQSHRGSVDVITDFTQGEDLIDLQFIDAVNPFDFDNGEFIWVGSEELTKRGRLNYHYEVDALQNEVTVINSSISYKEGTALEITLIGRIELHADDFIL
jgi:hypothetical protein